jgi:tRNA threonylcarbamoyl adenosine modification protein (Sua5/YciO/YrdC/YwlC family)
VARAVREERIRGAETLQAELLRISAESPEPEALRYAAGIIARGGVVAVPTDTLYGLAADPFNLAAIEEIFRVKGRPDGRALPILVCSVEEAILLVREVPATFLKLAEKFWPGAVTLVLDASHRLPLKVTANTGRVALRWPKSKVVCALIEETGGPITGTSANISGCPGCSTAAEVMKQLGAKLPLVLDGGGTEIAQSSTVVGLKGERWEVLREGAVSAAAIAEAMK